MKLSVSTCAFSGLHKTAAEQLEACSKTKFKYIDLSLGFVCDKTDYQKDIDEISLNQEKFGISFTMGHTPYRHNPLLNEESFSKQLSEVENAIVAASKIGIDRVTAHGGWDCANDKKELLDKNVEYFKRVLECAEKNNVTVMLENISTKLRKCTFDVETPEDILYIAEHLKFHPLFKACWDTGHANTMALEQYNSILKLKDLIYGVHLQDNNGYNDDHMIPLLGTINFDEVIQGLKDVGYTGPFNFEIQGFRNGNTWPNFRNKYTENYKGEQLLFNPDEELRYLGIDLLYNVANYMAKKHNIKID